MKKQITVITTIFLIIILLSLWLFPKKPHKQWVGLLTGSKKYEPPGRWDRVDMSWYHPQEIGRFVVRYKTQGITVNQIDGEIFYCFKLTGNSEPTLRLVDLVDIIENKDSDTVEYCAYDSMPEVSKNTSFIRMPKEQVDNLAYELKRVKAVAVADEQIKLAK